LMNAALKGFKLFLIGSLKKSFMQLIAQT